jgi:hypothetical protein
MADAPPTTVDTPAVQAGAEVGQQISEEVAPFETDIGRAERDQAASLEALTKMYSGLLPFAQSSAKFVGDYYQQGLANEQSIFDQAVGRLNDLKQQRSAEAQDMAQKIGGPVNVNSFLAPLNTSLVELPNAAATSLFHANALAQGGVQEAEAFAGRVFPMMRVEQEKQVRLETQQKIQELKDNINRIKSSKGSRTQTRYDELVQRQHEYQLEQQQLKLDRLKADRDWRLQQQQLRNQQAQVANDKANLLGYYDKVWVDKQGRKHTSRIWTLDSRKLTEEQRQAIVNAKETHRTNVATETMNEAELAAAKVDRATAAAQNKRAMDYDERQAAAKYLDAAMTPGTSTVTRTTYDDVATTDPRLIKKGVPDYATIPLADRKDLIPRKVGEDAQGKPLYVYYKPRSETVQVTTPVIENPTELYTFLTGHGISKAVAIDMVRKRLNLGEKWKPGDKYDPVTLTEETIQSMKFNEARREARKRGWKPDPNHRATADDLRAWLMKFYGYGTDTGEPVAGPPAPGKGGVPAATAPPTGGPSKTPKGKSKPGSNKNLAATYPGVEWSAKYKYWWIPDSGKVVLRGHPPDRNGNPT